MHRHSILDEFLKYRSSNFWKLTLKCRLCSIESAKFENNSAHCTIVWTAYPKMTFKMFSLFGSTNLTVEWYFELSMFPNQPFGSNYEACFFRYKIFGNFPVGIFRGSTNVSKLFFHWGWGTTPGVQPRAIARKLWE